MSRGVSSGCSIRSTICRGSGAQTRKCVEPSGWISAPAGYRLRTSLIVEWTPAGGTLEPAGAPRKVCRDNAGSINPKFQTRSLQPHGTSDTWTLRGKVIVSEFSKMRLKLTIEYAGTRYSGWQIQKNARTVQGELDRAAREVTGRKDFELYGSGRTDAGVHALAQVAHLDVATSLPAESIRRRINDELPADIHILDATVVPH